MKSTRPYYWIKKITDKPIKFVINTHADFDHTGGNKLLAETGATVIMQKNAQYSGAYGDLYFDSGFELNFNNEKITVVGLRVHSYSDSICCFLLKLKSIGVFS